MSNWEGPGPVASAIEATSTMPPRGRRRVFGDARLLMGVVLVLASIGGVWAVVAVGRQTHPVYAAAHTLVAGQAVGADDLEIVEVSLGRAEDEYLTPAADLDQTVATRTVEAGELLPAAATGDADDLDRTTVVIQTSTSVPSEVGTGTSVEVWAAAQSERGHFDAPTVLVPRATVASVDEDDSMLGEGGVSLELVIPREAVADALAAISSESALSVVPAGARG